MGHYARVSASGSSPSKAGAAAGAHSKKVRFRDTTRPSG